MELTHVKIKSSWRPEVLWEGDVDIDSHITVLDGPVTDEWRLDYLLRFFNRVDFEDTQRLEQIGYDLPSMSMGDEVEMDGVNWICSMAGWKRQK
jgi:hypothetical protein